MWSTEVFPQAGEVMSTSTQKFLSLNTRGNLNLHFYFLCPQFSIFTIQQVKCPDLCISSSLSFVIQGIRKVDWSRWTPYLWRMWEKKVRPTRQACAQVKGAYGAEALASRFALEICWGELQSCEAADVNRYTVMWMMWGRIKNRLFLIKY